MHPNNAALVLAFVLCGACTRSTSPRTAPATPPAPRAAPPDAAPAGLTDARLQEAIAAAEVADDAFATERNYTALLGRDGLTVDQQVRVLFTRAAIRGTTAADKVGAIADYGQILALAPEHELAALAQEHRIYAETQLRYIEERLAARTGSRGEYVRDLLETGRHDEAARFARDNGLSGYSLVEALAKLGYLCEGDGYSAPSYRWGDQNTTWHTVYWCDSKAPPAASAP